MKCQDHLGNEFNSVKDMCASYEITYAVYRKRKAKGYSLKDILTQPMRKNKRNFYHYDKNSNVSYNKYLYRIKHNYTQEKSLSEASFRNKAAQDHLGNQYASIQDMCCAYNINYRTFSFRIRSGWDIKKALTYPDKHFFHDKLIEERIGEKVINRNGEEVEIVAYKNVNNVDVKIKDVIFKKQKYERFKAGLIGTEPCNMIRYKNKYFKSVRAIAEYENVSYQNLWTKIKKGATIEEAVKAIK